MESGRTRTNNNPIFFHLDQGERAAHLDVNQLLPRDIYERLADLIKNSVPQKSEKSETEEDFLATRGHRAIFIDGDRGTGKTTVAVNLYAYLESPEAKVKFDDLASDVHVLKPIDPTQLEDNDDLFLNVIVAAVLSDGEIKDALERSPKKRQQLHEKLQALGDALQGRETQKENYGLDRLRAFMGSQALAYAVHEFFLAALSLMDKRLLVMPIDDVDTSLHKAFDYLEVVRRYLSSTAVLPIVCGDFNLYRDVTQRDSFRRLTINGRHPDSSADEVTSHLAVEYLRKILPVQRRLQMPNIAKLLDDPRIFLLPPKEKNIENGVSLPQFKLWLRALLEGPVNGHENSTLSIPIPTVRALSQLVGSIQKQFPSLVRILHKEEPARPSTDLMQRLLRIAAGARVQREEKSNDVPDVDGNARILESDSPLITEWCEVLLEHFRFVPDAGHVCLVLLALQHWRENPKKSVLATPLFAPLAADEAGELRYINRSAGIQWDKDLNTRVPSSWLSQLPSRLVIPFATPEIGRAVRFSNDSYSSRDIGSKSPELLLLNLVVHRNFYSQSHQGNLLCTGRILELLTTSLVRDISTDDIDRILTESPFHSVAAIAKTKAITISSEDENDSPEKENEPPSLEKPPHDYLKWFAENINQWRNNQSVDQLALSPWLTYCAINKTLNQATFFNSPGKIGTTARRATWRDAFDLALATFNAFWAAYASFEKGPIFGQPIVLSNINLTISGDFEKNNLYMQNVLPMLSSAITKTAEGDTVLSVTRLLATHPLHELIKSVRNRYPKEEVSVRLVQIKRNLPREELLKALDMVGVSRFSVPAVVAALRKLEPDVDLAKQLGNRIYNKFSSQEILEKELKTLEKAISSMA